MAALSHAALLDLWNVFSFYVYVEKLSEKKGFHVEIIVKVSTRVKGA